MTRRLILVLGMHRSGTSVLTGVLNLQGAALPKTLMKPQADNADGFWESQPIVRFNEMLLQSAERAWDDPRSLDLQWWQHRGKRLHRIEQAKKLLQSEYPTGELVVLKDPRISRLLPIWLPAIEQAGFAASIVLVSRNPGEVAASLDACNGIAHARSHLLWLQHMTEAEKQTRHLPRAFLDYEDLLADWRSVVAQVGDDIGFDSIDLAGDAATAIDALIKPANRHHNVTTDALLKDPSISSTLKAAWVAFQTKPKPAAEVFENLCKSVDELIKNIDCLTQPLSVVSIAPQQLTEKPPSLIKKVEKEEIKLSNAPEKTETERHVVLHYHLFKNAGTSVDKILKQHFKDGWAEHEGPGAGWKSENVGDYLVKHPAIKMLSSHTALLPVPELPNTVIYPIIFIRHPIDRIRSIYEFEHKQIAETEGAIMAKKTDLAGYINWRLDRKGDRSIRNFQTYRLAMATPAVEHDKKLSELDRALKALETLPFVGIVEEFDTSLQKLEQMLKPLDPTINLKPTKANVTQKDNQSLEQRLEKFTEELGVDLYAKVVENNAFDLKLYYAALKHFGPSK